MNKKKERVKEDVPVGYELRRKKVEMASLNGHDIVWFNVVSMDVVLFIYVDECLFLCGDFACGFGYGKGGEEGYEGRGRGMNGLEWERTKQWPKACNRGGNNYKGSMVGFIQGLVCLLPFRPLFLF